MSERGRHRTNRFTFGDKLEAALSVCTHVPDLRDSASAEFRDAVLGAWNARHVVDMELPNQSVSSLKRVILDMLEELRLALVAARDSNGDGGHSAASRCEAILVSQPLRS
ncbi:hypothetical protein JCM10908_002674 [Rhodotorula pacifica]|uniref:uncharacterized protein n=1 Tax=Rhodotorula pacifica TaxID=1495444 RepID=UPI00317FC55E